MIVLGYAGQGSGFAREQPVTADNRDFWRVVDGMLYDDVRQPPEDVRNTVGHPVWGLRLVKVADADYWCFTVQGRGGPFGAAGICRFAFFPESTPPGEAWARGRESVAHEPRPDGAPPDIAPRVRQLFDDVDAGHQTILLDLDPADAALVIEYALHALPASACATVAWTTCLLQRHNGRLRTVTGQLPAEVVTQAPSLEQQMRRLRPDPPARVQRSSDQGEAVDWVLAEAYDGRSAEASVGAGQGSVNELLDRVIDQVLTPTVERVPLIMRNPAARRRLLDGPGAVARAEWMRTHPAEALGFVMREPTDDLAVTMFADLVALQRRAAKTKQPVVNLIGLPDPAAPAPDGWADALPRLLKASWEPGAIPAKVMTELYTGATDKDLLAGRGLLQNLGIGPGNAPKLFPMDAAKVRHALDRGRLDAYTAAEFDYRDDAMAFVDDWFRHHVTRVIGPADFADNVAEAYRCHRASRPSRDTALASLFTALKENQERIPLPASWCNSVRVRLEQHGIKPHLSAEVRKWLEAQKPQPAPVQPDAPRPVGDPPGPPPPVYRPEPDRDLWDDRHVEPDELAVPPPPDGQRRSARKWVNQELPWAVLTLAIVLVIIGVIISAVLRHGGDGNPPVGDVPTPSTITLSIQPGVDAVDEFRRKTAGLMITGVDITVLAPNGNASTGRADQLAATLANDGINDIIVKQDRDSHVVAGTLRIVVRYSGAGPAGSPASTPPCCSPSSARATR